MSPNLYLRGRTIREIIIPFTCILILFSCKAIKQETTHKNSSIIPNQLLPDGVDFFAKGDSSEPWTLIMDFDKCYVFSRSNEIEIRTIAVKPSINQQNGEQRFLPFKSDPYMSILLTPGKCTAYEKKTNNYFVTIKLNDRLYKGCGDYVVKNKLSGTWELTYIDNEAQFALNYNNKIPTLNFDLKKNKIRMYDGCTSRTSKIEIKGNQMIIEAYKSEPESCENKTMVELMKNYMNGQSVEYYFRNENLVFLLSNDTRIVFQKRPH